MTREAVKADLTRVLKPLDERQLRAADPRAHVWLNASAGTGKTQVLAARVLRLLLDGVNPDAILCITFTKAGAAEMAHRVHERLAIWVGCDEQALRVDLQAIGVDYLDTAVLAEARTLFARVIDSPLGAIRVQTIHSFCQSLLASFPVESGILPGFRLVEGSDAAALRHQVLGGLLTEGGDAGERRRDQLGRLSRRLGAAQAVAYVEKAAGFFARSEAPRLAPTASDVRAALDLPTGDVAQWQARALAGGAVSAADVAAVVAAWRAKSGPKELTQLDLAAAWQAADGERRVALTRDLLDTLVTSKGELRADYRQSAKAFKYAAVEAEASRLAAACQRVLAMPLWCATADDIAAALALAADYSAALQHRKLAEGLAEYDDLIARTAALLARSELADWIRFKLDQRIDHLLIDEAQDTNAAQWTIADGLTGEFFAGEGARGADRVPSMFVVGDRKQAIFGFQGTDPAAFEAARRYFTGLAAASDRPFAAVDLVTNFRSSAAILGFVDRWLDGGGVAAMGIDQRVPPHSAHHSTDKPGRVELWPPIIVDAADGSDADDAAEDGEWSAEQSLRAATDPASLKLAGALADRVARWTAPGGGIDGLPVKPGDVLILVRRRAALAARIVAQLQARGVPVAGVDRFALADPLAVQDLLAALRFMVQPDDEYSLAVLLVSPLFGWTQQQLYDESRARGRTPLRQWLEAGHSERAAAAHARLEELRAGADFATPFRTLDRLLAQPWGRAARTARLGAEANDAIDALLAEALTFEARGIPSLTGFLDHMESARVEIKRQTEARGGLVRVMTVHGSKGLQAPIVILADAVHGLTKQMLDVRLDLAGWHGLPLFRTGAASRPPRLQDAVRAAEAAAMAEHWRLFYVAATRAERMLVVTGTQKQAGKLVPPTSWYAAAETALAVLDPVAVDIGWEGGPAQRYATQPGRWAAGQAEARRRADAATPPAPLPDWALRPAPEEARPPRPLAPSQLGADDAPQRPAGAERGAAIRRGLLLHALIERLPDVPLAQRDAAARRWLAAQAVDVAEGERAAWAAEACAALANPEWRALFGPGSLAEAPFSAVIDGGLVIAGTVDRLLVTETEVLVLDYKTGAHVPAAAAAVAPAFLRQMAAYAAALAVIFPGRTVSAALLYTAAPRLIALPADLLAAHKPGLEAAKANLDSAPLEPDHRRA
jgi:ATP-dependent helicase/nuclease subunit A